MQFSKVLIHILILIQYLQLIRNQTLTFIFGRYPYYRFRLLSWYSSNLNNIWTFWMFRSFYWLNLYHILMRNIPILIIMKGVHLPIITTIKSWYIKNSLSAILTSANWQQKIYIWNLFSTSAINVIFFICIDIVSWFW